MNEQLWLELPPISERAPRRLMVFLHGAGSSPEAFAPIALAWQLRFPGAIAILMQGLRRFGEVADWFDPRDADGQAAERARSASDTIAQRIVSVQQNVAVDAQRTVLIGHAQGATLALDMVRAHPALASIVVAYAGRLTRPIRDTDTLTSTIHLIHGEFDSVVPAVHGSQAYRGLRAIGADVSLDIVEDEAHSIGQGLVNLGTTRVMQTLFRGRQRVRPTHILH